MKPLIVTKQIVPAATIVVSEDGYIRLRKVEFKKLAFQQLAANADPELRGELIGESASSSVAGFCEWASDTTPAVSIGFDWYINDKTNRIAIMPNSIRTNLMMVSARGRDYWLRRTSRFLLSWIESFLRPPLPPSAPGLRATLTQGERDILLWAAEGKTAWEIAKIVGQSERTVKFRRERLIQKLGATNMVQAAVMAFALGIIS